MTSPVRLLADENRDQDIVRGVMRRMSELDLVVVQDVGLAGASDAVVLDWAARERRVVLTHDARTMVATAFSRIESGQSLPGLLVLSKSVPIGQAIEEIVLVATCSLEDDWTGQVRYLPL